MTDESKIADPQTCVYPGCPDMAMQARIPERRHYRPEYCFKHQTHGEDSCAVTCSGVKGHDGEHDDAITCGKPCDFECGGTCCLPAGHKEPARCHCGPLRAKQEESPMLCKRCAGIVGVRGPERCTCPIPLLEKKVIKITLSPDPGLDECAERIALLIHKDGNFKESIKREIIKIVMASQEMSRSGPPMMLLQGGQFTKDSIARLEQALEENQGKTLLVELAEGTSIKMLPEPEKDHQGRMLVPWEVSVPANTASFARLMRAVITFKARTLDSYMMPGEATAIMLVKLPEGEERDFGTLAQADMHRPPRVVAGHGKLPPEPFTRLFNHADWVRGKGLVTR